MTPEPSIRALLVGKELRRHRTEACLHAKEVASTLGISASVISKLENGLRTPTAVTAATLLGFYQVSATERGRLLAHVARAQERGWHEVSGPGLDEMRELWTHLETEASQIATYQPQIVPHQLQTPEYADMLTRLAKVRTDQLPHSGFPRTEMLVTPLTAIIDESVLTESNGLEVIAHQMRHLARYTRRPTITLRVLPTHEETYTREYGSFTLLDFTDRPSLVHVWAPLWGAIVDTPEGVAIHRKLISSLLTKTYQPVDTLSSPD